ncbi:hypothetical protein [Sphingomonas sp. Leaf257]|jgi:hypothetical protein|uniref:hypothetical protein n=1 Tax=Sphingomonas sp. Leaf257 TaxID=1736309 RepID=UPI000701CCD8|nr:hypothetical protein [Sphingomonas sp. Leaf257]KQO51073.1 hypothetical protein ASF14_09335 [Sphingomonas sp. Leaf257]
MRGKAAIAAALGLTLTLSAAKSDPFAGRVAGPPVQCVDTSTTMSGPVIADKGVIVINAGRRVWRAKIRGQCFGIQPFNTLLIDRWGSQVCRNDRFRVLQQGLSIPSAWCFFDGFVPYDRVKK